MNMKKVLSVSLLMGLLFFSPLSSNAETKTHRVLFAVTSGDELDWRMTVGNIHNLLTAMAPDSVEIEVVAFGPGLSMLRKSSSADSDIHALETKHVRFIACENSMKMQHVSLADLVEGVQSVPSGIVEVVKRQEQGWAYIKGGR